MLYVEDVRVPAPEAETEEVKKEGKAKRRKSVRKLLITMLPASESVMKSLATAQNDYEQARYAGFSEDELVQYEYLSNKIKENIQRVLAKSLE